MKKIIETIEISFEIKKTKKENPTFLKTILYCFLLNLIIELLQPFTFNRSSDIIDLITK